MQYNSGFHVTLSKNIDAGIPLVWSSPAINRVADRLSKRIINKRYTALPETDVEMVVTGSGTPENSQISSRSPKLAFKQPVRSDDIEEESDDIEENIGKQVAVVGYSESHRITTDTNRDVNSIASPCHSHTPTTATPVEEVKRLVLATPTITV